MPETLLIERQGSVAHVMLNRPEAHNAMSNHMVSELLMFFQDIREDRGLRVVVIGAVGKTFCAGGDIKDMQASAGLDLEAKVATMSVFDQMLRAVNEAPQVTITRVQGAAMGGGFGLVCVSDIAIAGASAKFGLPEVRLGVVPALISPYVIQRVGLTRARQMMLTGERFDAATALGYGLIHAAVSDEDLVNATQGYVEQALECSPNALAETKRLIFHVTSRSLDESLRYRAELISTIRDTPEAQEGMLAFIQKRKPSWAE
jgi:isohexenylglutaconyl-CoA hydratase